MGLLVVFQACAVSEGSVAKVAMVQLLASPCFRLSAMHLFVKLQVGFAHKRNVAHSTLEWLVRLVLSGDMVGQQILGLKSLIADVTREPLLSIIRQY